MYDSFDDYQKYIEGVKNSLPSHVYEFALDVNRHNLDSPHSLHDAWLTSITIREHRNKTRPFESNATLVVELLGPMHDRDIILKYEGIVSYRIEGVENPYNSNDTFHGDIACHEVRLNDDGCLVHEILMASEAAIEIVCRNFSCSENVIA